MVNDRHKKHEIRNLKECYLETEKNVEVHLKLIEEKILRAETEIDERIEQRKLATAKRVSESEDFIKLYRKSYEKEGEMEEKRLKEF